jgi:two-component system response regulator DegU
MSQLLQETSANPGPRFRPDQALDPKISPRLALHRVILYSPHPLLLAGLRAELSELSGFKVVAETGSPTDLLDLAVQMPLSLVIFDPARPGETLRLVRAIQKRLKAPVPMIVLNGETKGQVAQLKALGVIPADKAIDSPYFKRLVEQAVHGRRPLPGIRFSENTEPRQFPAYSNPVPAVNPAILSKPVVKTEQAAGKLPLSQRELQILGIIGQGRTNKEVAETLCISSHTLKNHLNNIFKKLSVEDRTQALMVCVRRGWVTL